MLLFYKICLPAAILMLIIGWPLYSYGHSHQDIDASLGGAMLSIGACFLMGWLTLFAAIKFIAYIAKAKPNQLPPTPPA